MCKQRKKKMYRAEEDINNNNINSQQTTAISIKLSLLSPWSSVPVRRLSSTTPMPHCLGLSLGCKQYDKSQNILYRDSSSLNAAYHHWNCNWSPMYLYGVFEHVRHLKWRDKREDSEEIRENREEDKQRKEKRRRRVRGETVWASEREVSLTFWGFSSALHMFLQLHYHGTGRLRSRYVWILIITWGARCKLRQTFTNHTNLIYTWYFITMTTQRNYFSISWPSWP